MGIFPFTTASRTALGPTQPPIQWVPGALSLGVKRPGRGAIPPVLQYAFMAWRLVKHRDNFTFFTYNNNNNNNNNGNYIEFLRYI
jgi:hypothetical protein